MLYISNRNIIVSDSVIIVFASKCMRAIWCYKHNCFCIYVSKRYDLKCP